LLDGANTEDVWGSVSIAAQTHLQHYTEVIHQLYIVTVVPQREVIPNTRWIKGYVGPRVALNARGVGVKSLPLPETSLIS